MKVHVLGLSLLTMAMTASAGDLIKISAEQQRAVDIQTMALLPLEQGIRLDFPARVSIPNDQLRIVSTTVSGIAEHLEVAEGQAVRQGQPLARIHSSELLELQRDYLQTLSQLQLAARVRQRDADLFKQGIIAQRRYQESEAAWQQLSATAAQQKAALKLAGLDAGELARLTQSRQLIDGLILRAPITGIVLEQKIVAGEHLEPATALYRLAVLDPLWLEIHAPAAQAALYQQGDTVEVPAYGQRGRLITIGQRIHEADQGVLLRAQVDNPAGKLLPGQLVSVRLQSQQRTAAGQLYQVPQAAISFHDGKPYVFLARTQGFEAVAVQIVSAETDQRIIRATLPGQAHIAVRGIASIKGAWTGMGGGE
jgi:RND family efflux transporter MFP subunit